MEMQQKFFKRRLLFVLVSLDFWGWAFFGLTKIICRVFVGRSVRIALNALISIASLGVCTASYSESISATSTATVRRTMYQQSFLSGPPIVFDTRDAACIAGIVNYGSTNYISSRNSSLTEYKCTFAGGNLPFSGEWGSGSIIQSCSPSGTQDSTACVAYSCPADAAGSWTLSGSVCTRPDCDALTQVRAGDGQCVAAPMAIPPQASEDPQSCPAPDGLKTRRPIIPATGEKVFTEEDHGGQGVDALDFVRTFTSNRVVGAVIGVATAGMGQTWSHNHNTHLRQGGVAGTPGSKVLIFFGDGAVTTFAWDAVTSGWKPSNGIDLLVQNATGFLYKRPGDDTAWQFGTAGKLLTVRQRNGWTITYTYSTAGTAASIAPVGGLLIGVTNQFGRTLSFKYNAARQLTSAAALDGRVTSYGYDSTAATGRLVTVTYPPAATGGASATRTYLYESTAFPQLLTGIVDETGHRLATVAYDDQGRAISSGYAGGADLYNVNYSSTSGTATVTDPLGTQRTYSYGTAAGKLAVLGADKPSGSGASSAASRVQDLNGLISQESDFLGINTMYTWDINRRLPLTTTRAAGLPEAQTRTIEWHPSYGLPLLVAEAGRTITYTYDGKGNKLSQTATDSATSQSRTSSWTYNAMELPVTVTNPNGAPAQTYAYYGDTSFPNNAQAPGSFDPNINAVNLLLHGDGGNGATSFTDSSLSPKAMAAFGDARISTAQSKFGGASAYFDGAGDFLFASPSDWNFGSSAFTVDVWVHHLARPASGWQQIVGNVDDSGTAGWRVLVGVNGEVHFSWYDLSGVARGASTASNAIPLNQWAHLAVSTAGGTTRIFVNGISLVVFANAGIKTSSQLFLIGSSNGLGWFWNGYLDELRVTKGVGRYVDNFSPPTQAFPNMGETPDPNSLGHRAGDLQSITNAAGHVTQFTLYDQAGRVRQTVDPKGIVTDMVYSPRGWLGSVTVTPPGGTARTTTYTYDNVGQLTGAALADGSTLGYSYDAAHRMTGVTDAKGNSVTYTLDAMGNKTGEQVKDPSGNLQRNITRVYDALNRVQQVTGTSN
jgi:YD repeat-containing protein